jgi:hypothetical protein
MVGLWPSEFKGNDLVSVKDFLEGQADELPNITGKMVYAKVEEGGQGIPFINNEFVYRFELGGYYLENYRFRVFIFSHDILLYPVKFLLDEELSREFGYNGGVVGSCIYTAKNYDEMVELMGRIFKSRRVNLVVGSIMQMSRKYGMWE